MKKNNDKNNQHIIPLGNGWAVKKEGSKRFTIITDLKNTAIKVWRQITINQRYELIIHGKDGKITDKDNYSNDMCIHKVKKH